METLGYERLGAGPVRVLVLNDWLCDTTTWDSARPYLDAARMSWVFADLRGDGRSKNLAGRYNLEESASDVLRLADHLGWVKFSVLGHSMSALIALHLAQHFSNRIQRAVALTPPPPTGFGVDDTGLAHLKQTALADDAARSATLYSMWGNRLSEGWIAYKAARWRAAANPEAVAAYASMFAKDGLPEPSVQIKIPVLAITGELDAPIMRQEAVAGFLLPLCKQLTVVPFAECGHYPMQEMPPLLMATVESFLSGSAPI